MRHVLMAGVVVGGAVSTARPDVVVLAAVKDNTLYDSGAGELSNGAGPGMFVGVTSQRLRRRGLIAFDVAAAVPAGSRVASAALTLSMSMTRSGPINIGLYAALAEWGEGTSLSGGGGGIGAPAAPGDATWLHTEYPGTFWSAPGGDFESAPDVVRSVGGFSQYTWGPSPEVTARVQAWLDDPASNFGWVIKSADEVNSGQAKRFDTREFIDPALRPALRVEFEAPCYADCDRAGGRGMLDVFDFLCFQNRYAAGEPYACDCDTGTGPGVCDVLDFLCFGNAYGAGCP
jgi:hypothetical protein